MYVPRPNRELNLEKSIRLKDRTPILIGVLVVLGYFFAARLFYLQIINHDNYRAAATADEQYKKFSIPAERGNISLRQGDATLPVVLNEDRYLIYADPELVTDIPRTTSELVRILGVSETDTKQKLETDSRYQVIARKVSRDKVDELTKSSLKGIVAKGEKYRTYPEGMLASQLLGFVNDDGEGQYGVEEYLDEKLRGSDGLLKGITDVNGVPLAGNR